MLAGYFSFVESIHHKQVSGTSPGVAWSQAKPSLNAAAARFLRKPASK
jgi:hypothetical protein